MLTSFTKLSTIAADRENFRKTRVEIKMEKRRNPRSGNDDVQIIEQDQKKISSRDYTFCIIRFGSHFLPNYWREIEKLGERESNFFPFPKFSEEEENNGIW